MGLFLTTDTVCVEGFAGNLLCTRPCDILQFLKKNIMMYSRIENDDKEEGKLEGEVKRK